MERTTGYYNTFVVKIWCDKGVMRGHIQHVSSQEQTYFLNMADMVNFVAGHLGPPREIGGLLDRLEGGAEISADDYGMLKQDDRIFSD